MNIPQSMLLDWAERINSSKKILDTTEVQKVSREIRTYATANEEEQSSLRQFFYLKGEN